MKLKRKIMPAEEKFSSAGCSFDSVFAFVNFFVAERQKFCVKKLKNSYSNSFLLSICCVIIALPIANIVLYPDERETRTERKNAKPHVQNSDNGQGYHKQHIFQFETCNKHRYVYADSPAQKCGKQQFSVTGIELAFVRKVFVAL